jgi:hypothetical protein
MSRRSGLTIAKATDAERFADTLRTVTGRRLTYAELTAAEPKPGV